MEEIRFQIDFQSGANAVNAVHAEAVVLDAAAVDARGVSAAAARRPEPPPGACGAVPVILKILLRLFDAEQEDSVPGVVPAFGAILWIVRISELALLDCRLLLLGECLFIVFSVYYFLLIYTHDIAILLEAFTIFPV